MSDDSTTVIFRKYGDGEVIALFPYELANVDSPWPCVSYMHVGQHGAADLAGVMGHTEPATPDEYAPLMRELESQPYRYRLTVRLRTPKDAAAIREREWRNMRRQASQGGT
jgi:hypothetical protein